MLARTTLSIEANLSAAKVAATIAALQRVPGVLFAEVVDPASAVVAHDAGVLPAALVAAAAGAGVRARAQRAAPPSMFSINVPLPQNVSTVRLVVAVGASVALSIGLANLLLPNASQWLVLSFVVSCGMVVIVEIVRRRLP